MSVVIPNLAEAAILAWITSVNLTLQLYNTDIDPVGTSDLSEFTAISGGGYAAITLTANNWEIVPGAPSLAIYNDVQNFIFTGPIAGDGIAYGYYIQRAAILFAAEKFPLIVTPVNGLNIRIRPVITLASLYGD